MDLNEDKIRRRAPRCRSQQKNALHILEMMSTDQIEHRYWQMTDVYKMYRSPVVEWMVDVCDYFKLHVTTTHGAIAYLDRLQPDHNSSRQEWQMIAIACIMLSAKYNECEVEVPPLAVFENIIHQTIPNETMLQFELWVLKRISWQLNARTPAAFLSCYDTIGISQLQQDDKLPSLAYKHAYENQYITEAMRLAGICIIDPSYKPYRASDMAGSILYYLRQIFHIQPIWKQSLIDLTLFDPLSSHGQKLLSQLTTIPLQITLPPLTNTNTNTNSYISSCNIYENTTSNSSSNNSNNYDMDKGEGEEEEEGGEARLYTSTSQALTDIETQSDMESEDMELSRFMMSSPYPTGTSTCTTVTSSPQESLQSPVMIENLHVYQRPINVISTMHYQPPTTTSTSTSIPHCTSSNGTIDSGINSGRQYTYISTISCHTQEDYNKENNTSSTTTTTSAISSNSNKFIYRTSPVSVAALDQLGSS